MGMMATVKDLVSNVRGSSGDFIHRLGGSSGDLLHRVGGEARHVGGSAANLARNVGDSTVQLARRIGPKRGLIGLAILGAVVGGTIVLVRYLRARAEEQDAGIDANEDPATAEGKRTRGRAKRKTSEQMTH